MTTSNTSDVGELQERESLSQANIDMKAEKILKVSPLIMQNHPMAVNSLACFCNFLAGIYFQTLL